MYIVCQCPNHRKNLVHWKDTATHSIFKCPECDYADYPGVVHPDLPERYNTLRDLLGELYDEAAYEWEGEWVIENKDLQKRVNQVLKE